MKAKKTIVIGTIVCLVVIAIAFALVRHLENRHPDKFFTEYFDGEYGYQCDHPIKMRWVKYSFPMPDRGPGFPTGGTATGYQPVDKAEAKQACHITSAV